MECKITSIKRRRSAGYNLIEVMIASALGGLAVLMLLTMTQFTSRSIASMTDSVGLNSQGRYAVDRMSQKIRQASAVSSFASNAVTVIYEGEPLTYEYRDYDRQLVEIRDGTTTTLLKNCDELTFALYKRNPVGSSFNQFPADNNIAEAKVVQVSWRCRTTRVGTQSGAEDMISARIVLRSK